MLVHICMLTQVYELLITQLDIFSINFINIFSYYHCIRYLVSPALFPSISMVFNDYHVLNLPQNTGPHSAVGNVSAYRCLSDCRSRGREFDPGQVPYFRRD